MSDARTRLLTIVRDDNTVVPSLDALLAQGRATLGLQNLATESGQPPPSTGGLLTETDHVNKVNLFFGDSFTNPLPVAGRTLRLTPRYLPYDPNDQGWYYVWVSNNPVDQNPNHNVPESGPNSSDFSGKGSEHITGISLKVGRSTDTRVGDGFRAAAFYPNQANQPTSVLPRGVSKSESGVVAFPESLNFAFSVDIEGTTGVFPFVRSFRCENVMFAQGSTKATRNGALDILKDLGDLMIDTIEVAAEDGSDFDADARIFKTIAELAKDILDFIIARNWWVVAVNAQVPSGRIKVLGFSATTLPCTELGTNRTMAATIASTYHDNGFAIYLTYPGETLHHVSEE